MRGRTSTWRSADLSCWTEWSWFSRRSRALTSERWIKALPTSEGHNVEYDEDGRVVSLILVNARWLLERDGEVTITWPAGHITATELAGVLQPTA
jgi:hypothetical protein